MRDTSSFEIELLLKNKTSQMTFRLEGNLFWEDLATFVT